MNNDLLYQIALTLVPGVGDIRARTLIGHFGDATAIFKTSASKLEKVEGIGKIRAANIKNFKDFTICEREIRFLEDHQIKALLFNDKDYPRRLLHCYDAPALLYYLGNADLNAKRIVSVVGTRNNTEYGKAICESLIAGLSTNDILIVSGLAYGIDTIAHRMAIKNKMNTVAALAHGLDRIYPSVNRSLAKEMIRNGGIISDFPSGTNPDKQNFPKRNRIVAGLCDCVVVIQTGQKGGSIITAELGNDYNKDVFAFPGRVTDQTSEGCHYLIGNQKAELIVSADDLLTKMNWKNQNNKTVRQVTLFPDLDENEAKIVSLLREKDTRIDELLLRTNLTNSNMAATLLSLEMKSVISSLPGKLFKLTAGFL